MDMAAPTCPGSKARAKAAGYEPRIGCFPIAANGKAIALGEDRGLVKTIFDAASGKPLGAQLIGAEEFHVVSNADVPEGKVSLAYEFEKTGEPDFKTGKGAAGKQLPTPLP